MSTAADAVRVAIDRIARTRRALAAGELGLEPAEPRRVAPYDGAEHRYLHVMSKVRETPGKFPRRPGMALKRPLGAKRSTKR